MIHTPVHAWRAAIIAACRRESRHCGANAQGVCGLASCVVQICVWGVRVARLFELGPGGWGAEVPEPRFESRAERQQHYYRWRLRRAKDGILTKTRYVVRRWMSVQIRWGSLGGC